MAKKNLLVVLPSGSDHLELPKYENEYNFFWLEDSSNSRCYLELGENSESLLNFDVVSYVQKGVDWVKRYNIDGVVGSWDFSALLAAAICEDTGLPGTSFESQFICCHKYYSRITEGSDCKLWFDYIDLPQSSNKSTWSHKVRYPCRLKPTMLFVGLYQSTIRNEKDMEEALAILRLNLTQWFSLFKTTFLRKYIDLSKYPLAASEIVLIEELVDDGTQYTIEGWMNKDGKPCVWGTADTIVSYHPVKHTPDFVIPSTQPDAVVKRLEKFAVEVAKKYKIKNYFFNVELWYRDNDRIDVIEINCRIAAVYEKMYVEVYSTSVYYSMLRLACQELEDGKCLPDKPTNFGAAGWFLVHVFKNGLASELVNFKAIYETNWKKEKMFSDGVGIDVVVKESAHLSTAEKYGYVVAKFCLSGDSYAEIAARANEIRSQILY